jgi:hypothetical protein
MLMAAFVSPLLVPFYPSSEKSLPACCRRDGKHHCAMRMAIPVEDGKPAFRTTPEACPYRTGALFPNRITPSLPTAVSRFAFLADPRFLPSSTPAEVSSVTWPFHSGRGPPMFR